MRLISLFTTLAHSIRLANKFTPNGMLMTELFDSDRNENITILHSKDGSYVTFNKVESSEEGINVMEELKSVIETQRKENGGYKLTGAFGEGLFVVHIVGTNTLDKE